MRIESSIPVKDKIAFTVRLSPELHERLREHAFRHRVSRQDLLYQAIDEVLAGGELGIVGALSKITTEEARDLKVCLDILRNAEGQDKELFQAMLTWWRRGRR